MKTASAVFALILSLSAPSFGAEKAALAVLDFVARDVPREDAAKISMLIRNEMSNLPKYRTLDREQIPKALGADASCDDVSCAVEAGTKLGVRTVIVGSIMKFGDNLTVTGRVIDAESGAVLMAEKERAVFQADEFFMVERFCDRLARRMTGRSLYAEERAEMDKPDGRASVISSAASGYRPAADPTVWLALGSGIASGMGFLEAAASFHMKKHSYQADRFFCTMLWSMGVSPSFPDPALSLTGILGLINVKNDLAHARRIRDTEYYVAAGIGGFAALMFTAFIGRNIAAAINGGTGDKTIDISLVMPSPSLKTAPAAGTVNLGLGLGLAMRF
ncbi:MAG TPA: hypothetical protein PLA65_02580 [Spirochaetota bacterium]|nr:hypothetical protein [Spirochaetota bacterium]HOD16504.1 hypothetical protein [Spirochaetota bacterium]HPN10919.1 hypothetical protein [Spirochaetota bacterium]